MIPARLDRGEEVLEKKDMRDRLTAITAVANRTQMPCSRKISSKETLLIVGQQKKWTPNRSSIRLKRRTGRPITLKKSPSSRSTRRAPSPWTP